MRIRAWITTVMMVASCAVAPVSASHVVTAPMTLASDDVTDLGLDLFRPTHVFLHHVVRRGAPRHVTAPAAHGPCPAYGTVLVPGGRWLAGQGVDVMSNGGTGADCDSMAAGHRWQCGELINRFLAARGWSSAIAGDAAQFYGNADPTRFDKHPIGSGYLPVPGDVVVWSGGPGGYGHVAIVVADSGGALTLVEQNSTITGYGSIAIDAGGAIGPTGSLQPEGYLHARANPQHAAVATPPRTPKRPPAGTHHRRPSGGSTPPPAPVPVVPISSPQASPTTTVTPTASATPTATSAPSAVVPPIIP